MRGCDIFDQSVVVACGNDGKINTFHNVCQHHGNRLPELRRGSERLIAFDKQPFNIHKVRVEELGGFVYFDAEAPTLAELLLGGEQDRSIIDIRRCNESEYLGHHFRKLAFAGIAGDR